jgi:hypothetical protein
VLPFPFHLLNNNHAMNVRPLHYDWLEFYDRLVDLSRYSFSWRAIRRRLAANRGAIPRWMNVVRAVSSEGFGRIRYHTRIRELLDSDLTVRAFLEGRSSEIPRFYTDRIRSELGSLWDHLPDGALHHDPLAYLKAERVKTQPAVPIAVAGRRG